MTNETTRYDTTLSPEPTDEEAHYEISLRPKSFEDFVGQEKLKDNLRVMVEAAAKRGDPVDHVLFCGPPGLGKTTLAHILAEERGVELHSHSAPALEHKGQLGTLLTKVEPNDIIFIDEIHRLSPAIEEYLYTAVEDFQIEIVQGDGPYAQSFTLPLQPFTLVAATTRTGLLTNPMRTRFGYMARLDYYAPEELAQVVTRSARLLDLETAPEAAIEVARRARGTPRIANRLLRRARDFAQVRGNGKLDLATAQEALERLDVDEARLPEPWRPSFGSAWTEADLRQPDVQLACRALGPELLLGALRVTRGAQLAPWVRPAGGATMPEVLGRASRALRDRYRGRPVVYDGPD